MQSALWDRKGIPAKGKGNVISSTLLGIYVISLCFPSFTSSTYLMLVKECIHYIHPKKKNKEKLISIKVTWCSPLQILSPVIIQHSTNHPQRLKSTHSSLPLQHLLLLFFSVPSRVKAPCSVCSVMCEFPAYTFTGTSQDDYFRLRM